MAPPVSLDGLPKLSLGEGHDEQEKVVVTALLRLLVDGNRGIVLADEVGFGKTYEALAVVSQLCAHAKLRRKTFDHVLVLCKPALVRKWEEETSTSSPNQGFPRYLRGHPAQELFAEVRTIDSRATANDLRSKEGLFGQRIDGRNQVPPGIYIVNERLLAEEKRKDSTLLRQIWRTRWDVVIVDEAHHYAHENRPVLLFAPDGQVTNYDQQGLQFDKILALTATPFELTPNELVNLFALIKTDEAVLGDIKAGLKKFVKELERFFELREHPPTSERRQKQVALLKSLRDEDALDEGRNNYGLQALLRRGLIRNTKSRNERRYSFVEYRNGGYDRGEFGKLEGNLKERVQHSPLIPFGREQTLFYLELRQLIQDADEGARHGDGTKTFIPMELRQGLSSYRQLEGSNLFEKDLEGVQRLKTLITNLGAAGRKHPKVAAAGDVVGTILDEEIRKVRDKPGSWFSKVLIFNKLIRGTAGELKAELETMVEARLEAYLMELLASRNIRRDVLEKWLRRAVDDEMKVTKAGIGANLTVGQFCVPDDFTDEDFCKYAGRPVVQVFHEPLRRRSVQPLVLIDFLRDRNVVDGEAVRKWVRVHLTEPVLEAIRRVQREIDRVDHAKAERDLLVELERSKSVDVIGRFDGVSSDREAHRRNFNRRHNPFVLLVGQVGEEGIDLQEQCRYIIHYDLEWNPARMEQREGRVDRTGWGRASENYIDVRFLLLKGTYEERIFHTMMQRDQWFQVLIGSKRRELGSIPDDDIDGEPTAINEDDDSTNMGDRLQDVESTGLLTEAEKKSVLLDLRPECQSAPSNGPSFRDASTARDGFSRLL